MKGGEGAMKSVGRDGARSSSTVVEEEPRSHSYEECGRR